MIDAELQHNTRLKLHLTDFGVRHYTDFIYGGDAKNYSFCGNLQTLDLETVASVFGDMEKGKFRAFFVSITAEVEDPPQPELPLADNACGNPDCFCAETCAETCGDVCSNPNCEGC